MIGVNHFDLDKPWPKATSVRCWDIQCDMASGEPMTHSHIAVDTQYVVRNI